MLRKILKKGKMSVSKIPKMGENRANLRESFSQIGRNFSQNFLIFGGYPPPHPTPPPVAPPLQEFLSGGKFCSQFILRVCSDGQLSPSQKNQWAITFGTLDNCHQLKKSMGNKFRISG
jgi:hypothetical protein